jgi:hypothetical protein
MTPVSALGLHVTDADIAAIFEPFLVERLGADDARWIEQSQRLERKYAVAPKKERRWTTADGHRTSELVRIGYQNTWSRVSLAEQIEASKPTYFEWHGEGMLARAIGRKRVHQLLLVRVFEWLCPSSVVEVGFGNGLNLLLLSMQFPEIGFLGVELTAAGLAAAQVLIDDPLTPQHLHAFAVGPLRDPLAPRRLVMCQGSADALPLADKSVDVAITVLALEQMERIREAALCELARVARRHVVMIEPFADWNADGHRREYIRRHDYFAARVDEMHRYGLHPIVATADIPNKLSFRAGLVVASVGAAA